jgi:hypothetical protein
MRAQSVTFGLGLLLVQAAVSPSAQAASVMRFPANTDFAVALSNPTNGPSQLVAVSRSVGDGGGVTTFLGYYYTDPSGCFFSASGTIPNQSFSFNAGSASLYLDTSTLPEGTLAYYTTCPDANLPTGVIQVTWTATGSTRTAGGSTSTFENITFHYTGTTLTNIVDMSGSLFGTTLVDPNSFSYTSALHQNVIRIEHN